MFKKDLAYLRFLSHSSGSPIFINDNQIDVLHPDNEGPNTQIFFVYVIPIPFEFLVEGKNKIEFSAKFLPHIPGYDDNEFGEVEMWFQ
jgi:hypothetical protein